MTQATGIDPRDLEAGRWLRADPADNLARLRRLADASRRELRAVMVAAEPRRGRSEGPRLVHRRSGLVLCLVPAGDAPAFLLAEDVLVRGDGPTFELDWGLYRRDLEPGLGDDVMPFFVEPDEVPALVARLAALGLELPRDLAWEEAYRAGTTTLFPWGGDVPSAPPAPRDYVHPLGLCRMGAFDELTADDSLRGGAGLRPWPVGAAPSATWQRLRSDMCRLWDGAHAVAIRPALSLAAFFA